MSLIKVGVLKSAPESVWELGFVRDFRVRWALDELRLPYEEQLVDWGETETPDFLRLSPFGQIPTYQEGDLKIFESGAILLHIAEKSETLMPTNPIGRAHVHAWMFAALSSVEPYLMNMFEIDCFNSEKEWAQLHRPAAFEVVQDRLKDLSNWLSGRDYLDDRFTVADLLMTSVLGISKLQREDLVAQIPALNAYRQRCEARPAYRKP